MGRSVECLRYGSRVIFVVSPRFVPFNGGGEQRPAGDRANKINEPPFPSPALLLPFALYCLPQLLPLPTTLLSTVLQLLQGYIYVCRQVCTGCSENSNGYWKYLLIQIFLIVADCFSKWMDFRSLELRLRRMDNSWGWFLEDFYPPALKSFLKFSMLTWNNLCIKWEWKFRSLVVESCTPKRGEVVKLWKFVEPLFLGFRAFVQEGRIHFWKWISKKLYFYNLTLNK